MQQQAIALSCTSSLALTKGTSGTYTAQAVIVTAPDEADGAADAEATDNDQPGLRVRGSATATYTMALNTAWAGM